MKVVAAGIEMVAWFQLNGTPNPVRFRYNGTIIKINKVISTVLNKLAGNNMYIFTCRGEVNGQEKTFEIRYLIPTCRWELFKI